MFISPVHCRWLLRSDWPWPEATQRSSCSTRAFSCKRYSWARLGTRGQRRSRKPGRPFVWTLKPCAWSRTSDAGSVDRLWWRPTHAGCRLVRWRRTCHKRLVERDLNVCLHGWYMVLGPLHGVRLWSEGSQIIRRIYILITLGSQRVKAIQALATSVARKRHVKQIILFKHVLRWFISIYWLLNSFI